MAKPVSVPIPKSKDPVGLQRTRESDIGLQSTKSDKTSISTLRSIVGFQNSVRVLSIYRKPIDFFFGVRQDPYTVRQTPVGHGWCRIGVLRPYESPISDS